jgi:hypothetical protein
MTKYITVYEHKHSMTTISLTEIHILTEKELNECMTDLMTKLDFITLYLVQSLSGSYRCPKGLIVAIQPPIHLF